VDLSSDRLLMNELQTVITGILGRKRPLSRINVHLPSLYILYNFCLMTSYAETCNKLYKQVLCLQQKILVLTELFFDIHSHHFTPREFSV
jgi:hypothetical protein